MKQLCILRHRSRYYLSDGFKASEIGEFTNETEALTYSHTHLYRLRHAMNRQAQLKLDDSHKPVQSIGVVNHD